MDDIDRFLAIKTRLTTIKGFAQLVERDIGRLEPRPVRLGVRIAELNSEIARLVELVAEIESSMSDVEDAAPHSRRAATDDYMSSGC